METTGQFFKRISPALDDYRHAQPCPECDGDGSRLICSDALCAVPADHLRLCERCDGSGQIGRARPRGSR